MSEQTDNTLYPGSGNGHPDNHRRIFRCPDDRHYHLSWSEYNDRLHDDLHGGHSHGDDVLTHLEPPVPRWQLMAAALTLLGVCVLFLTCCATVGQTKALTVGICAADITTSAIGVHRGAREVNPLYGHHGVPVAVVVNLGFLWAVNSVARDDNEAWTWAAIVRSLPVIWNLTQLRRNP